MNLYIYTMIAVFIFFNIVFAIAQSQKNNGLIDIAWGLALLFWLLQAI